MDHLSRGADKHLTYLVPTLISYFLDQKVGLLFYSPVFILSLAGFVYFSRKNRLAAWVLFLMLAAHLMVYAYSSWVGGHSPPPRPLVSVIWILGFFLIAFFREEKPRACVLAGRLLALLSFGLALIFLTHPGLLYHTLLGAHLGEKSRFLSQLESPALPFTRLFPSLVYVDWREAAWLTLAVWGILALGAVLLIIFRARKRPGGLPGEGGDTRFWSRREVFVYTLLIVGGLLFWRWAALVPVDREVAYEGPLPHQVCFLDPGTCWIEAQGFWVNSDATTKIYLITPFRMNQVRLVMRGLEGNRLRFSIGDRTYDHGIGADQKVRVTVPAPEGRPWKGRFIYTLSFTSIGGWVPADTLGGTDHRHLGFFVKMFPS
jgi:hypothetical protein